MNRISAAFFVVFVFLLGLLPYRLLYVFSDFLRFVLYYIVGYRKKVVIQNLKSSFPDKSEKEIMEIVRKSYRNLSDIMVESFKSFTMSKKSLINRYKFINAEEIAPFESTGRSVILAAGHHGNWEWSSVSAGLQLKSQMVGLYKPLSNKYIDALIKKSRGRTNTTLASIYETQKTFNYYSDKGAAFMMAGDQNPGNPRKSIWVNFLGRPTAFLNGIERYAVKHDLPVVFGDARRLGRGRYEITLTTLCDNPRELPKGEITRLYTKKLEEIIYERPENWLWSHKRWKMTLPENTEVIG